MKRFVWLGVVALVLAAIPAAASTFVAMSRGELGAASDAVIQGRVLKVSSFWTPSGRMIATEALVQVDETVKGRAPGVVVVRTYGGTVGGFTVEAHGFPKFAAGERVLLFLRGANETAEVTGYQLGHYRIVRDKSGVEVAVPTFDARLVDRQGRTAAAPKAMQLDELKDSIRAEAEKPGAGRTAN